MSINPETATPLYIQLKHHLEQQIASGTYSVGQRLPSERELAERHGVSRMTARHALQSLLQDGFAYTQIGKGTFVAQPKIAQELSRLSGFTEDMVSRRMTASNKVLQATTIQATHEVAAHLELEPEVEVIYLARIRLAADTPVAIERAYLELARFPNLLDVHDFATESLYTALRAQYDVHLAWARQEIEARMPSASERSGLQLEKQTPVLSLARVTYDDHDRPVEYVNSCYNSQRYRLTTMLRESAQNRISQ